MKGYFKQPVRWMPWLVAACMLATGVALVARACHAQSTPNTVNPAGSDKTDTGLPPIPFQFAPYSLAPPAQTVIGDLGGVPVSIPREYVRNLEYEGETWLQPRKGPPPERTLVSKLTSFTILVHLPTMKPLIAENFAAYNKRGWRDRAWVDFGVAAGTSLYFHEADFENPYPSRVPTGQPPIVSEREYERLPDEHGLQVWRAKVDIGLNLVLDDNNRDHSSYNHRLYFAYEGSKITNYIKCGSGLPRVPGGQKMCLQYFPLWPDMRAEVQVQYVDDELLNWRTYEQKTRELMLSFRADPKIKPPPLPPASGTSVAPASATKP